MFLTKGNARTSSTAVSTDHTTWWFPIHESLITSTRIRRHTPYPTATKRCSRIPTKNQGALDEARQIPSLKLWTICRSFACFALRTAVSGYRRQR
ncbi:hypothetical protein AB1N83_010626 [Pleurotus pulmonarius]